MFNPLLATKLYLPAPRFKTVSRARLLKDLDEGLHQGRRMSLICAPAGYGKSMLASEWLEAVSALERPAVKVSWLSLDENDNDINRFLAYLAAALQRLDANLGQGLLSLLRETRTFDMETLLTGLINEIDESLHNEDKPGFIYILAIDDYHKICLTEIHQGIQFLLDHQPPGFHLLLLTRVDPPLRVSRLRAKGEVTEIRAQNLRFTLGEAEQYFNLVMQLNLDREGIQLLEGRTEGWAAGLQLAALSLQGRADVGQFLEDFHGSHRYVIDYLMDEVLALQSEETRLFLSQTSILDRFCAPLCEALTGRQDSEELISRIEQLNLFLIPLDERREWYRYHHLFSDFLRTSLEQPLKTGLHRRASLWYEQHGSISEAIDHAFAAQDYGRAAELIERAAAGLVGNGQLSIVHGWLNSLPEEVLAENGNLMSHKISCLYHSGWYGEALEMIQQVDADPSFAVDEVNQGRLLGMKAWTAIAAWQEDAIDLAQVALARIGDSDPWFKMIALITLGHAFRQKEDLDGAAQAYQAAVLLGKLTGQYIMMADAYNSLAFLLNLQGKRLEALEVIGEAAGSMVDPRQRPLPAAELLKLSQSALMYEANEVERAVEYAAKGIAAHRRLLSNRGVSDADYVLVRGLTAQGSYAEAEKALREIRQQGVHFQWVLPWVEAVEAELAVRQGNPQAAAGWLENVSLYGKEAAAALPYQVCLTYCRILLSQDQNEAAKNILQEMEKQVRKGGFSARQISVFALRACVERKLGSQQNAYHYLEEALRLAASGGYLRRFLDEGEGVGWLLREWIEQRSRGPHTIQPRHELNRFAAELIEAFSQNGRQHAAEAQPEHRSVAPAADPDLYIEPISEQERKVLRLLCAGLSNQEIASELFISVGTAKWHVHNIYGKLGVSSRTQAIARALELKLF